MTAVGLLVHHEFRRVLRAPLVWCVLALLLATATAGALNAARLHDHQTDDIRRLTEHEAQWYADVRARAARYATPSAEDVPYWQDPTGASGFSRYFLKRFAAKPHLPLSVLAVGHSDLQPFAIPVRLETLFGGDRVYDFVSPRALATGPFDLSFVLVFLLPLSVGAATAMIGSLERDGAILSLVAAQGIGARRWWSVRLGVLATVLTTGAALCLVIALMIAGAPLLQAWPETLAVVSLVATLTLMWVALAGACVVRGQGAIVATSTIAGIWLTLTVGVPLAGSLAVQSLVARPSPTIDVNELRRVTDHVQQHADTIVTRRLIARLGRELQSVNASELDYATRLVLITDEMEGRLAVQEHRREQYALARANASTFLTWLSPQLAFETALVDLAGTGNRRHQEFLRQVRMFQLDLRAFIYPRVLEQVRSPTPRACEGCPGRLNFGEYDDIPQFVFRDLSRSSQTGLAVRTAGWLGLIAGAVALLSIGRGERWALDALPERSRNRLDPPRVTASAPLIEEPSRVCD